MIFDDVKRTILDLLARLPIDRFRNPAPIVGVIRFDGVIGRAAGPGRQGINLESHEKAIAKVFSNNRIKAVALVINSPGGSPVQSALVAKRIRDLANEKELPVIAFCEDVAASGGYWLACVADEIFADENSILGSIGVISAGFGFTDLIERFGIERRVYSTGPRKGMLDPFLDEKDEEVDRLRELHHDIFENFKNHVRHCRGDRLRATEDALFTGDVWTGRQAVEVGLVDGLAEVREEMRKRFGKNVKFYRAGLRRSLISKLRGGTLAGIDPTDLMVALDEWAQWKRFGL
jgi:signal peptide peptidase SppA